MDETHLEAAHEQYAVGLPIEFEGETEFVDNFDGP